MIGWLIGLVGGIGLVVIMCLVLLVAAVAASPFGIFFANEPSTNTIPLSSAVAQINMELNTRLIELQDGEYETIEIHGTPPEWAEVIAVFAAHIAGAENGMDVALLDAERVELLRDTFWDMCSITSEVETEEPPTTGTYRSYGLDCSGFADWVFYNASGGEYVIGHGGGAAAQHRYCIDIPWNEAQPGDLVFYPGDTHVGIVAGWGEDGNILINPW